MNEIDKPALPPDDMLFKSIDNVGQSLKLLNHFVAKNEILQQESIRSQVFIASLKNQIEELSNDVKRNYPSDRVLITKSNLMLESPDMEKATEVIRDIRIAIGLMHLIAAKITSFDGDPELWYRYTDVMTKLEGKMTYLP
jgi:hypothetical protein